MQSILDYLKELAQEPEKKEQFKRQDLRAVILKDVDLSAEDKELLLKGDWEQIRKKLGDKAHEVPMIYYSEE